MLLSQVSPNSIHSIPNWLLILTQEEFFSSCLIHGSVRKNEKNILCLDCCTSICPHCLPLHRTHVLLQVRTNFAYISIKAISSSVVFFFFEKKINPYQLVLLHSVSWVSDTKVHVQWCNTAWRCSEIAELLPCSSKYKQHDCFEI